MPYLARGEHDEIHRHRTRVKQVADFSDPLRWAVSALHDDQQIEIAIGRRLTVCVGTEQVDVFRVKRTNDLLSDLSKESWSDRRSRCFGMVCVLDVLSVSFQVFQIISPSGIAMPSYTFFVRIREGEP